MSLLDSLNSLAKTVGDKAGEAIEISKLNGKINSEKLEIQSDLKKIGTYYYEKHRLGEESDPQIFELLSSIDKHYATIQETEKQIELCRSKEKNEII